MLVKLKLLRGANAGKEIPIKRRTFTIGRTEDCNLRVNSEAISRKHCVINISDSAVTVEDCGSKNGTFVNGKKTTGAHPLSMGDQLRVGPLEFLVTINRPAVVVKKKPSDDDELGGLINDWLSESEAAPAEIDAETREYRFDDTDKLPVNPDSVTQEIPIADGSDSKKEKDETTASKKSKKNAPKDTQEAAAQTLRKFFNRGG